MQQLGSALVVKKQRVAGMQHVFGSVLFMNYHILQIVTAFWCRGTVLAIS
jgi:hypothetical protein